MSLHLLAFIVWPISQHHSNSALFFNHSLGREECCTCHSQTSDLWKSKQPTGLRRSRSHNKLWTQPLLLQSFQLPEDWLLFSRHLYHTFQPHTFTYLRLFYDRISDFLLPTTTKGLSITSLARVYKLRKDSMLSGREKEVKCEIHSNMQVWPRSSTPPMSCWRLLVVPKSVLILMSHVCASFIFDMIQQICYCN